MLQTPINRASTPFPEVNLPESSHKSARRRGGHTDLLLETNVDTETAFRHDHSRQAY